MRFDFIKGQFCSLVFMALLATTGCREQKETAAPPLTELARVGSVTINQDEFQRLLKARAMGDTAGFTTPAAKEALLDELIRREAAYAKATAAGFDQRPDIQEMIKRMVASKFQEEQLAVNVGKEPPISERQIKNYYQEHTDKFTSPAAARGAVILIKIPNAADDNKRAGLMAKAQAILDEAKSTTPSEFALLTQKNSEDQATRYRGGDTGWVSESGKDSDMDLALKTALLALKNTGDFAPLVPTKKGVCILKLIEARPAETRPLATVRDFIAYTLGKEKQQQREREFFASVKSGLEISINREMLESIQLVPSDHHNPPELPQGMAQVSSQP